MNMKEALNEIMFLDNLVKVEWCGTAVRFSFENDFEFSLAFGRGSYSSNNSSITWEEYGKHLLLQCNTVEVAVFTPDGNFLGGEVGAYTSVEKVLHMAKIISQYEPDSPKALTFDPSSTTI
jgi:hypothetical protein